VWQLTGLLILFIVSCPLVAFLSSQLSYHIYDEILLNSADSVIARIENDKEAIKVDLPASARQCLRHQDKDSFYYQVLGPNDQLIDCDEYIPLPRKRAKVDQPVFYNSIIDGNKVRVLELRVAHHQGVPNFVTIEVAETANTRQALANLIMIAFLITQTLFISGSAITVWLGTDKGLMPLKNVALAI
jgi:two-component system sensor histidine kinase TctE